MKVNVKIKTISAIMAVIMLFTACGNTAKMPNTENSSTEESQITVESEVTIEKEEAPVVTTPSIEEVEPTPEELEQQEWQNYMMPNVESSLNVRVEPNVEAELAGKLDKGDRATVLEVGTEWTKIESGQLIGYVSNEFCVYGADALAYAKANCKTIATSITDGLRIREEQSLESKIMGRLEEGETIVVDTNAVTEEGWVAVRLNDATYYVSAEYVTVALEIGTGITKAEMDEIARQEEERVRLEEERIAREAQAKKEAAEKVAKDNRLMKEVDDLTLMAAIIYCEANIEPYETKVAVGAVIVNRMKSAYYGGSLYDVLSRPGQFTPYRTGKLAEALAKGKANAACYEAAREALAGVDNTNGCLYFNDYNGTKEGIRYGGMVFWW